MQQIEERPFQHNGNSFLLRLVRTENGFVVVAFLGGQQVSPSYGVDFITHTEYFMQHQKRLTEQLFRLAQSDLEQGIYFHG